MSIVHSLLVWKRFQGWGIGTSISGETRASLTRPRCLARISCIATATVSRIDARDAQQLDPELNARLCSVKATSSTNHSRGTDKTCTLRRGDTPAWTVATRPIIASSSSYHLPSNNCRKPQQLCLPPRGRQRRRRRSCPAMRRDCETTETLLSRQLSQPPTLSHHRA